jgi:ribosomal protein L11 methyltransferase
VSEARWSTARLTALFKASADATRALSKAGAELGWAPPPHEMHDVIEQDWVRATQAQFAPLQIHDRLWIVPSWCESPDPSAINVTLDPGLAFGTGSHPTTRGCLEALERLTPGASLADLGSGSGVIAVAAALLGWARVLAVDVSPPSIEATRANASLNGVEIEALVLDLTQDPPPSAETLVANVPLPIHSEIVSRLADVQPRSIIASGVPAADSDALVDAYAGASLPVRRRALDGWAIVTFGEND